MGNIRSTVQVVISSDFDLNSKETKIDAGQEPIVGLTFENNTKGTDEAAQIFLSTESLSFFFDGLQLFSIVFNSNEQSRCHSRPSRSADTHTMFSEPCHNEIPAMPPAASSSNHRTNSRGFPTSPAIFCDVAPSWCSCSETSPKLILKSPCLHALQVQRGAWRPYQPLCAATSCACTAPRQPLLRVTGDSDAHWCAFSSHHYISPASSKCYQRAQQQHLQGASGVNENRLTVTPQLDFSLQVSPVFQFIMPGKPCCCFTVAAAPSRCVCKVATVIALGRIPPLTKISSSSHGTALSISRPLALRFQLRSVSILVHSVSVFS
ncbi:uncharacterized protein LOC130137881 [Syzygium oleosum]|uniref:uncharacterized protein LOC130137881 n=1 Tax=Syzygium oleosum TaxID=219896 RepID=UPI0024BB4D99|nr:uncharacterized protein LOC130137881 [Syzygium oleosum]